MGLDVLYNTVPNARTPGFLVVPIIIILGTNTGTRHYVGQECGDCLVECIRDVIIESRRRSRGKSK